MIFALRSIRCILGVIAATQLIHLLAILARLANWDHWTQDLFLAAVSKAVVGVIFLFAFIWMRPKINRAYKVSKKVDARILPGFWSI